MQKNISSSFGDPPPPYDFTLKQALGVPLHLGVGTPTFEEGTPRFSQCAEKRKKISLHFWMIQTMFKKKKKN